MLNAVTVLLLSNKNRLKKTYFRNICLVYIFASKYKQLQQEKTVRDAECPWRRSSA